MRAVVIDPVARQVRQVETDGELESLQALVGGYIELVPVHSYVPAMRGHHMYVDEMGRMSPAKAAQRWRLRGWPEPDLVGPGVVLTSGRAGEDLPATAELDAVRQAVEWL